MNEIILQGIKKDDLINEISTAVFNKMSNSSTEKDRDIEPLKDKKEAAAYLRISVRKLDYLTLNGKIKYSKIDSAVRFKQCELDAFVSRNEVKIKRLK